MPRICVLLLHGVCEVIPLAKEDNFPPCACGNTQWLTIAVAGEAGSIFGIGSVPNQGFTFAEGAMKKSFQYLKTNAFHHIALVAKTQHGK